MKKLITILMLFVSITFLFAGEELRPADQLLCDISDFIVDKQNKLKDSGYEIDSQFWTAIYYVSPSSKARFSCNFKRGETYVLYTMSNGPRVRTSCVNATTNEIIASSPVGTKIALRFKIPTTGKYYFYVFSYDSTGIGLQTSYAIRIFKKRAI